MIFAGMAVSPVFFGSNETRNNGGLQVFRAQKALSVLQPCHREKPHAAPVAVVNSMNYEG
jgi:hypothetical protein